MCREYAPSEGYRLCTLSDRLRIIAIGLSGNYRLVDASRALRSQKRQLAALAAHQTSHAYERCRTEIDVLDATVLILKEAEAVNRVGVALLNVLPVDPAYAAVLEGVELRLRNDSDESTAPFLCLRSQG